MFLPISNNKHYELLILLFSSFEDNCIRAKTHFTTFDNLYDIKTLRLYILNYDDGKQNYSKFTYSGVLI